MIFYDKLSQQTIIINHYKIRIMNFFCCGASTSKDKKDKNIKEIIFKKEILLNLDPSINLLYNQDTNLWEDVPKTNSNLIDKAQAKQTAQTQNESQKLQKQIILLQNSVEAEKKKLETVQIQSAKSILLHKLGQIVVNNRRIAELTEAL